MSKVLAIIAAVLLIAGMASADCTVTIANGQSMSPVISPELHPVPAGAVCAPTTGGRGGIVVPIRTPDALDATSYGLQLYTCSNDGLTCKPLQDGTGSNVIIPLKGGATPTNNIQLDIPMMVSVGVFRFQVVTSAGAAVPQTAARAFSLLVRSL